MVSGNGLNHFCLGLLVKRASVKCFGRWPNKGFRWAVALGLALGGIFGNLSDRIFRTPGGLKGEVVDWIQLPNWPIFNVADMSVVSAAILITYLSWKNVPFAKDKDLK